MWKIVKNGCFLGKSFCDQIWSGHSVKEVCGFSAPSKVWFSTKN